MKSEKFLNILNSCEARLVQFLDKSGKWLVLIIILLAIVTQIAMIGGCFELMKK